MTKPSVVNFFLAKSMIDLEKTTTANRLGLRHAPLNKKKGNKNFLQLKQYNESYSHHKIVASMCTLTGGGLLHLCHLL